MGVAVCLSLIMATLNLASAIVHLAISRAPGWRSSRAFAFIALSATFYSVGNSFTAAPGLSDAVYLFAARSNYLWAQWHVLAWIPFVWGGADRRWSEVPYRLRIFAVVSVVLTVSALVSGAILHPVIVPIEVPWAATTYHYARTTVWGDLLGLYLAGSLLVPFTRLWQRYRTGERELGAIVLGFAFFVLCGIVESLVASRQLVFLSPADLGFLAVVAPTSVDVLRRFIEDARRLEQLSGRLAGEVRDRTEERDRAEAALLEAERLAGLGRLAAGVGHEINNPLMYLQLSLGRVGEYLQHAAAPEAARDALADAHDGAWRIQKVVEGLRAYSRGQEEHRPLDPNDVVVAALKVAGPHLRHIAEVEQSLARVPRIAGDEPRLVQAVVNLLVNAAQAAAARGGSGHVSVRTYVRPSGEVALEVADDGPGFAPEARARLAEPYFTTRGADGGLGLGLFVTRGIVDAHAGRIEFGASALGGASVCLVFAPLAEADVPHEAPAPRTIVPQVVGGGLALPEGSPRLLLVDDEPIVLRMLATVLATEWDVVCATNGDEALRLLDHGHYDRVLCDLMLPGLSGMELADRIATRDPELRRRMVFLTGGAVTPDAQRFLDRTDVERLMKPVDLDQLRRTLRDITASGA